MRCPTCQLRAERLRRCSDAFDDGWTMPKPIAWLGRDEYCWLAIRDDEISVRLGKLRRLGIISLSEINDVGILTVRFL